MTIARMAAVLALAMVPPSVASAQAEKPVLTQEEMAAQLGAGHEVVLAASMYVAILDPGGIGAVRGLRPGGDPPAPGTTGSGVIPDLQVQFATSSARISSGARQQLGALALALKFPQLQHRRFVIAGHTDARGSEQANQMLSQKRADSVVRFLVENYSISSERLMAIGYGETYLADPANPASAKNRRVEVRLGS